MGIRKVGTEYIWDCGALVSLDEHLAMVFHARLVDWDWRQVERDGLHELVDGRKRTREQSCSRDQERAQARYEK